MRNLILAILVLGLGLVGLQAQASANLLTDSGFDTQAVSALDWGTTPWWGGGGGGASSGGGGWVTAAQSQSPSHSATLFTYGSDWAYAMAAQTLTSGIIGGNQYTVSAYFKRTADIGTATANFKVEWLNSGGTTIGTSVGTGKFDNTYGANVPQPDFAQVDREIWFMTDVIEQGLVQTCHDISDGGMLVTLAEMSFGGRGELRTGIEIDIDVVPGKGLTATQKLFTETGGFVFELDPQLLQAVQRHAATRGVTVSVIGTVRDDEQFVVKQGKTDYITLTVGALAEAWLNGLRSKL